MKLLSAALVFVVSMLSPVEAGQTGDDVFSFTFDEEIKGARCPSEFSFYGEILMDFGITALNHVSKPHAVFLEADFSQEGWGVIMLSNPGQWDLSDASLSVSIRTPDSFHAEQGIIGFKLIDADGREVRTSDADLHLPGRTWDVFSQKTSDIALREAAGMDGDVDLAHIVQIGVVIFDPPASASRALTSFYIDDLRASK